MNDTFLFKDHDNSNDVLVVFSLPESFDFTASKLSRELEKKILLLNGSAIPALGSYWEVDSVDTLSESAASLYKSITNKLDEYKIENIYTLGVGGGGYAALLFGSLLNASQSIAFSPQILFGENLTKGVGFEKSQTSYINLCRTLSESASQCQLYIGASDLVGIHNASLIKNLVNVELYCTTLISHKYIEEVDVFGDIYELMKSAITNGKPPGWLHHFDYLKESKAVNLLGEYILEFYENNNQANALVALDDLITQQPMWSSLYHWKGLINYRMGYYNECISSIDKSIALGASIPMNWLCKGRALSKINMYEDAIYALFKCIDLKYKNLYEVYLLLGICYLKLNKYKQAIYWQEQALPQTKNNYEAMYQLGVNHQHLGNQLEAENWYRSCLLSGAVDKEWIKKSCIKRLEDLDVSI